jgi:hypothetical protein
MTSTALAPLLMSKNTPPEYAFPRESQATVGSLHASAVWPSSRTNCQNGGTWSPHRVPPSKLQSYPQWLNPILESFWPAMMFRSSSGLSWIVSSA